MTWGTNSVDAARKHFGSMFYVSEQTRDVLMSVSVHICLQCTNKRNYDLYYMATTLLREKYQLGPSWKLGTIRNPVEKPCYLLTSKPVELDFAEGYTCPLVICLTVYSFSSECQTGKQVTWLFHHFNKEPGCVAHGTTFIPSAGDSTHLTFILSGESKKLLNTRCFV